MLHTLLGKTENVLGLSLG